MARQQTKATATHRDFTLTVQRNRNSRTWDGMAKGLGTVVFNGGAGFATAEGALEDLRGRLDGLYARGQGVFAPGFVAYKEAVQAALVGMGWSVRGVFAAFRTFCVFTAYRAGESAGALAERIDRDAPLGMAS